MQFPLKGIPRDLSLVVKQPEREADYSLSSSAKFKNNLSFTSTLPIRLPDVVLRHMESLAFAPS